MNDNPNQKQAILDRVREALRETTDAHVRGQCLSRSNALPVVQHTDELLARRTEFLPPVGSSLDDRIALFKELSDKLQTEFEVVDSVEAAGARIAELARTNHWKRVAVHSHDLVNAVTEQLESQKFSTDQSFDPHELEKCDAGISGCEALIAQTASVLVTAKSSGGRALSVLPPHHVVIARRNQMLGSMVDGYRLLHERYGPDNWPSFFSLITGPSRTADVERVLVLGAHGPKRLTVILI